MTPEEFTREYVRLLHAVQSGVEYFKQYEPKQVDTKHLRTGLNCVMSDHGALTKLLVEKGLITEQEYFEATLEGLRREVASYEERLNQAVGAGSTRIHLA